MPWKSEQYRSLSASTNTPTLLWRLQVSILTFSPFCTVPCRLQGINSAAAEQPVGEQQPPGRTVIDGIFETYRIRKVEPRIQDGAGSRRDNGQSRWEVLIQFVPSPFFLFAPTQRHIFPQTCLRNGVMGKVRRYTSFQYTAFRGTQE